MLKEAQEREHDKVMGPRRRGDDREDLGGFPGPGGRMGAQEQEQKGGCPWLQRAPGKRHFLRLWGEAKVKVTIVLWVGWSGGGG